MTKSTQNLLQSNCGHKLDSSCWNWANCFHKNHKITWDDKLTPFHFKLKQRILKTNKEMKQLKTTAWNCVKVFMCGENDFIEHPFCVNLSQKLNVTILQFSNLQRVKGSPYQNTSSINQQHLSICQMNRHGNCNFFCYIQSTAPLWLQNNDTNLTKTFKLIKS